MLKDFVGGKLVLCASCNPIKDDRGCLINLKNTRHESQRLRSQYTTIEICDSDENKVNPVGSD